MRLLVFIYMLFVVPIIGAADEQLMSKIKSVEVAADFTLPDPAGNMISLSDYDGKYVLINFWALWCSPCVKEFPAMQTLYESLRKEGLEIIAIHAGPAEVDMSSFLTDHNISFKVAMDEEANVKGWRVPVLPVSYLVDPEGNLIYEAYGPREWDIDEMKKLISSNHET